MEVRGEVGARSLHFIIGGANPCYAKTLPITNQNETSIFVRYSLIMK
jgi:hypothetical protein